MAKFIPFRGLFKDISQFFLTGVNVDQNIPKILGNGANQGLRFDPDKAVYTGRVEVIRWESKALREPKASMPKEEYI